LYNSQQECDINYFMNKNGSHEKRNKYTNLKF
jgi:hypothetical protein